MFFILAFNSFFSAIFWSKDSVSCWLRSSCRVICAPFSDISLLCLAINSLTSSSIMVFSFSRSAYWWYKGQHYLTKSIAKIWTISLIFQIFQECCLSMGPSLWSSRLPKINYRYRLPFSFSHLIAFPCNAIKPCGVHGFLRPGSTIKLPAHVPNLKRMSWYNRFCSSALGSTHVKFDAWPGSKLYNSFRSLESTNEETIMFFLKRSYHSMTLSPSQTVNFTTTSPHHYHHSQPT